ncbi:MAG: sodium:solute symporter family protein [Thermoanaerobaculia bacterium]|nr:sodium:solute symporter family protein [Thermoanaerobaculia bacterium]
MDASAPAAVASTASVGMVALWICAAYLVATLVMGILPGLRVSKSVAGYVAADRSMSFLVLYFVLGASVFSSFAFLGGPGWAYSRGTAALYILGYGAVGMVPFYFFGPRARRLGQRHGFVTQAELLSYRFQSPALSVLLAALSVIVFVPYLTIQMKGAGYILSTITEGRISPALGAGVTYAVVMIYVLFSGVLGVGWTNTFQGLFMMIIAWFLGLYLPNHLYGGVGEMFRQLQASDHAAKLVAPGLLPDGSPWAWAGFSSAVLVSAFGFSMWPHLFMKAYAAKSDRALRRTVVMYPTFQIFLVPILLIGFAGILAFPGVEPADTILPFVLTRTDLSPVLVGLVCAGTLAASMSSGDSILHSAASIGVRDGIAGIRRSPLPDGAEQLMIRVLVVVLSLVAYYYAVFSEASIVGLLLASYGGVAQIFPLMFAAFYWPRANGQGAMAGLLAGVGVNTFFLRLPELKPVADLHEGIYGLVVNVVVLVLVSLATPPQDEARVRDFVST